MAGNAACLGITIKPEIPVIVKGCRFPGSRFMVIRTTCSYFHVKLILRLVSFWEEVRCAKHDQHTIEKIPVLNFFIAYF